MGKHFIDPKRSEILSFFHVFPCTTQIALFWPKKLLPALFLKKPRYPCPFEILAEALDHLKNTLKAKKCKYIHFWSNPPPPSKVK
jgi:hypothetical protein